ncbi:MAG: flavin reductase family protein [Gemmataceae bacterium]
MDARGEAVQAMAMALGRLPSGLVILTARQGDRETGMLASWVQQCSFDPPQVTVAVRSDRDILAWLPVGAAFTVNLLIEDQTSLLIHFGKGFALDQPAFTGLDVERIAGEAPVLPDTLAYLLCRVTARYPAGDHDLIIGTVIGGRVLDLEARPYVHVRKNGLRY